MLKAVSSCQENDIVHFHYGFGKKKVAILGTGCAGANIMKNIDRPLCILHVAGADVNGKGSMASPLVIATMRGGYMNEIRLLLKAGADPNIPDDLGRLPVELSSLNDCMEEVEMLFPLTSPVPDVPNWSVDGVISHAKLEYAKPLEERHIARRKAMFKSQASKAFKLKDYALASKCYGLAGLTLLKQDQKRSCPISMGSKVFQRLYSSNSKTSGDKKWDDDNIPFDIKVELGDSSLLVQNILKIEAKIAKACDIKSLRVMYLKTTRQELLSKGLIASGDINDPSTHHLHHRTRDITARSPKYLSCLDVMENKLRLQEKWDYFVKHMIKERVYVIEDWGTSLGKVESLLYDHGILGPDDGTSFIIWRGRRILYSQVYEKVPCPKSEVAEVYAAIALLMRAREIGLKKLVLWTDSMLVKTILSGEFFIKLNDNRRPVFLLLRFLATSFDGIVVQYKPRELMVFVDDLTRRDDISHPLFPQKMFNKWKNHLEGRPIFRVTQEPSAAAVISKFVDDKSYGQGGLAFVLSVQNFSSKFDSLMGVMEGLNPRDLFVAVHHFEQKPTELKTKFGELFVRISTQEECTVFSYKGNLKHDVMGAGTAEAEVDDTSRGSVLVVFDASVPRNIFFREGRFIVILATPEEEATLDKTGLENFSAISYVRFRKLG